MRTDEQFRFAIVIDVDKGQGSSASALAREQLGAVDQGVGESVNDPRRFGRAAAFVIGDGNGNPIAEGGDCFLVATERRRGRSARRDESTGAIVPVNCGSFPA